MMRPSIVSISWVLRWFELVSLRSCLLRSSSRSLLLHQIHCSIIRLALLLVGSPARCRDAHAPHHVDERTPGCIIAIGTGTRTGTGTGLAVALRATRS